MREIRDPLASTSSTRKGNNRKEQPRSDDGEKEETDMSPGKPHQDVLEALGKSSGPPLPQHPSLGRDSKI